MYITIDGATQSATLEANAAARALVERLRQSPVTVTLNSSGGFEIWGALGFALPTSDQQMTTQPGDIVLYNGSNVCLFYGENSWSYTRLGRIEGLTESELRTFLKAGENGIGVTLSMKNLTAVGHPTSEAEQAVYDLGGRKMAEGAELQGIYIKTIKRYCYEKSSGNFYEPATRLKQRHARRQVCRRCQGGRKRCRENFP